jgi:hypothetical protein
MGQMFSPDGAPKSGACVAFTSIHTLQDTTCNCVSTLPPEPYPPSPGGGGDSGSGGPTGGDPMPASPNCPPSGPTKDKLCKTLAKQVLSVQDGCAFDQGPAIQGAAINTNHCRERRQAVTTAANFVGNRDLRELWGFGTSLDDPRGFAGTNQAICSGKCEVSPLGSLTVDGDLQALRRNDADGDSVPNFQDPCPLDFATPALAPDGSPLPALDTDEDGAADACDPHPKRFDRWVGQGDLLTNRGAYQQTSHMTVKHTWDGWLDSNQDGRLNGNDLCPFSTSKFAGQQTNANAEGEEADFGAHDLTEELTFYSDDASGYHPTPAHLGFVTRGDACDPYESSPFVSQDQSPPHAEPICGSLTVDVPGTGNSVALRVAPIHGRSANDVTPALNPFVSVDMRRCGCATWKTDPDKCFDRQAGECARSIPLRLVPGAAGGGWLPVARNGCAVAKPGGETPAGYCEPAQLGQALLAPLPRPVDWEWLVEYIEDISSAKPPQEKHFSSGTFALADGGLVSNVGFSFANETIVAGSSLTAPKIHTPFPRKQAQEADITPAIDPKAAPGTESPLQDANTRARWLRASFSGEWSVPATAHQETLPSDPVRCAFYQLPPIQETYYPLFKIENPCVFFCGHEWWLDPGVPVYDGLRQGGYPNWGMPSARPKGWALAEDRATPGRVYALDQTTGQHLPVLISSVSSPQTLASLLYRRFEGEGPAWDVVSLGSKGTTGALALPVLLLVGTGEQGLPTWWKLVPREMVASAAFYTVTDSGAAPGSAVGAKLFADTDGQHIIGWSDRSLGATPAATSVVSLVSLDLSTGRWSEPTVSNLAPRRSAQVVVHDGFVFRIGGLDTDGVPHGDVTRIDAVTGHVDALPNAAPEPFPARYLASAAWDTETAGLVLAGGIDGDGKEHSDVWSLLDGASQAARIAPDAPASLMPPILSGMLVQAASLSGFVSVLGQASHAESGLGLYSGSAEGWQELSPAAGKALSTRCPDQSTPRLCRIATSAWWARPGSRCDTDACLPSALEPAASLSSMTAATVHAFASSRQRLWVGRGSTLELWSTAAEGQPTRLASVELGARVEALGASDAGAGVVTSKGFVLAVENAGVLETSSKPMAIKGKALDVLPVGNGRFLVHTRKGAFLVDPPAGVRVSHEMEEFEDEEDDLEETQGKDKGKGKDSSKPAPFGARAVVVGSQVVLARGKKLSRLRLTSTGLRPDGEMKLGQSVVAMRAEGAWLYLVGSSKKHPARTLVGLGKTMAEAGAHDVEDWVTRRDDGLLRVRFRDDTAQLELARVKP